jgi:hypothetical protein
MREYFTYGSVRGAAGNGGPYRDRKPPLAKSWDYPADPRLIQRAEVSGSRR